LNHATAVVFHKPILLVGVGTGDDMVRNANLLKKRYLDCDIFPILDIFCHTNRRGTILNWVTPFTLARLSAMLDPRLVPGLPRRIEPRQIPWSNRGFGRTNSSGVTQLAYKGTAARLPLFLPPFPLPPLLMVWSSGSSP
jgi:hypothetical protein